MGSWAETDGITQLPINSRDKVRLFVIISQGHCNGTASGGGVCYSNDLWAPLGPGIQGSYNDYGTIEDIVENEDTALLLDILKKGWIPFKKEYEDVSDIKDMPLSEALHWIERDEAKHKKIYGDQKEDPSLGHMMVLEDVYQTMINYDSIGVDFAREPGKNYTYKPYSQILNEDLKRTYEELLQAYTQNKATKNHENQMIWELYAKALDYSQFFSDYKENGVKQYKNVLLDLVKMELPFEDEKVQKVVKTVIDMTKFNASMQRARKMWHPQSGKGGQDNALGIYKALNKTVKNIISAR